MKTMPLRVERQQVGASIHAKPGSASPACDPSGLFDT